MLQNDERGIINRGTIGKAKRIPVEKAQEYVKDVEPDFYLHVLEYVEQTSLEVLDLMHTAPNAARSHDILSQAIAGAMLNGFMIETISRDTYDNMHNEELRKLLMVGYETIPDVIEDCAKNMSSSLENVDDSLDHTLKDILDHKDEKDK